MNKYIPADKLIELVKEWRSKQMGFAWDAVNEVLKIIDSLQEEQPEDKQTIIITESHGDANIKWDCRSLSDVIALLKSAESFITEKQIEKMAGPGSGPDYATTEGRYSHLLKLQQERPEVDLEKEIEKYCRIYYNCNYPDQIQNGTCSPVMPHIVEAARHFWNKGYNARKGN